MLVLLASAGMMMMISANDLIALYLGLELQSLALYVTAAIRRDDLRSSEAGLKYFVLGALSSGMLLYGASLIYGFTGTTSFAGIAAAAKVAGEFFAAFNERVGKSGHDDHGGGHAGDDHGDEHHPEPVPRDPDLPNVSNSTLAFFAAGTLVVFGVALITLI